MDSFLLSCFVGIAICSILLGVIFYIDYHDSYVRFEKWNPTCSYYDTLFFPSQDKLIIKHHWYDWAVKDYNKRCTDK